MRYTAREKARKVYLDTGTTLEMKRDRCLDYSTSSLSLSPFLLSLCAFQLKAKARQFMPYDHSDGDDGFGWLGNVSRSQ